MRIPAMLTNWRHKLLWRHHALWSYRIDVFLLFLACYCIFLLLFAGIYFFSTKLKEDAVRQSLTAAEESILILKETLEVARQRPLTESETQRLKKVTFSIPPEVRKRFVEDERRVDPEFERFMQRQWGLSADLTEKFVSFIRYFRYLYDNLSYVYIGDLIISTPGIVAIFLPVILIAFVISNVFFASSIGTLAKHPKFVFILCLLLILILLPIIAGTIAQNLATTNIYSMLRDKSAFGGSIGEIAYRLYGRFEERSAVVLFFSRGIFSLLTVGILVWISGSLLVIRQFGWRIFLISSALNGSVIFTLMALNALDDKLSVLIITAMFALMFVAGMVSNIYREYLLCSGYLGLIAAVSFVGTLAIAELTGWHRFFEEALWGMALFCTMVAAACVAEAILRRPLLRCLINPR